MFSRYSNVTFVNVRSTRFFNEQQVISRLDLRKTFMVFTGYKRFIVLTSVVARYHDGDCQLHNYQQTFMLFYQPNGRLAAISASSNLT